MTWSAAYGARHAAWSAIRGLAVAKKGRARQPRMADPLMHVRYARSGIGLRRGEVLGLRWSDIDFETSTVRVRQQVQRVGRQLLVGPTKAQTSRCDLPMLEPVGSVLTELHDAQEVKGELVFTTSPPGRLSPGTSYVRSRRCVQRQRCGASACMISDALFATAQQAGTGGPRHTTHSRTLTDQPDPGHLYRRRSREQSGGTRSHAEVIHR